MCLLVIPSARKRVLRCGSCLGGVTFAAAEQASDTGCTLTTDKLNYFSSYVFDGTCRGCNVGDLRVLVCFFFFFLFCF